MLVRLVIFCRSLVIFSNIYKVGVVVVIFLGTAVLEHGGGGGLLGWLVLLSWCRLWGQV